MAMIEKVGVYCRLSDEDRFKANKNSCIPSDTPKVNLVLYTI